MGQQERPPILDYASPPPPPQPFWRELIWGIASLAVWVGALVVYLVLLPRNAPPWFVEKIVIRTPMAIGVLAASIALVGLFRDPRRLLAIVGLCVSLVLVGEFALWPRFFWDTDRPPWADEGTRTLLTLFFGLPILPVMLGRLWRDLRKDGRGVTMGRTRGKSEWPKPRMTSGTRSQKDE